MNLFELFKPTKSLIMEGIDHPEDLIISQGSAGADRVLKDLASLEKSPETVTVKWDGFPAVVFGRDQEGNLVFMDKHMYEKVVAGKMNFMSIREYDEERGSNRSDLWEKESVIRPALEKSVPNVKDKYWMGDLMWSGTPPTQTGQFVFKPNTVEYRVGIEGELGNRISRSVGGIAVHTYIPSLGAGDTPLIGLKGLNDDAGITFLVGEMKDKPRVALNKDLLAETQAVVNEHRSAVDEFIKELTAMKGKSVITAMSPFITRMLEENDIQSNIVPRFLEFLKERLSGAAATKMLGDNQNGWLYQQDGGAPGLLGIWTMWAVITDLKIHIKQQIDTQQQGSEVVATTDGLNAHEGYVFGAGADKLKLIDRLGFSRANFAKHKVPDEEIAQKSTMPLAAFCFGRMNPPTMGHGLVISKTLETGGDNSFVFLSNSNDPQENPLDPKTKAQFVSQIYPEAADKIVTDFVQGPIYAANWLYQKGFRNMAFVAGSDRLGKEKGSIEKLLQSWNSGPVRSTDPAGAREHVVIKFVSSGDRDPDAEGVTGYSGTKARQAAAAGNEQKFQQYTGVGPEAVVNGKTLYQATRDGMGIKDEPTAQVAPVSPPQQQTQPNTQVTKKVPGKAPVSKKFTQPVQEDKALKGLALKMYYAVEDSWRDKRGAKTLEEATMGDVRDAAGTALLPASLAPKEKVAAIASKVLPATSTAGKIAAKVGSKLVPGLATVAGAADAVSRAQLGDPVGAAISAGSGLASNIPFVGTAASIAGVGVQAARDKYRTGSYFPSDDEIKSAGEQDKLKESPIEMDPQNPNDPMVMPPGLNPGKLSYRKSRAASQLAELARMAAQANEADSPAMWDSIVKHFPELETNIRSIQHGMQELEARRRKGGIASRGIKPQ